MKRLVLLAGLIFSGCVAPDRAGLLGQPFTFVGIAGPLSETTFRDIDGTEHGLPVKVVKVTAGRFDEKQIEFPIPVDEPSPLKPGVKYRITAGYREHGRVILDYRELK